MHDDEWIDKSRDYRDRVLLSTAPPISHEVSAQRSEIANRQTKEDDK